MASAAANRTSGSSGDRGELYGAGYTEEIAVVREAVQYAVPAVVPFAPVVLFAPLVGAQVAVPRLVLPFVKVTEPVGPFPLLCVETRVEIVTLVPEVMLVRLLATAVSVEAFCTVRTNELLAEPAA